MICQHYLLMLKNASNVEHVYDNIGTSRTTNASHLAHMCTTFSPNQRRKVIYTNRGSTSPDQFAVFIGLKNILIRCEYAELQSATDLHITLGSRIVKINDTKLKK